MENKIKRKARGAGSIRKRSEHSWEGRVTIGFDPGTGKQIQKSVSGKTQREVRQKMTALQKSVDDGINICINSLTVAQWMDIWIRDYTLNLKPLTKSAYRSHIENNIKPYLGAVKLSKLTTAMIQNMYNRLSCGGDPLHRNVKSTGKSATKRKPMSPKTVHNLHGVLRKSLEQAVACGYINRNPTVACQLPQVLKTEIQPLTDDKLRLFLNSIAGDRYELIYRIDLFTGMRQGEVLGLCWDCVNFDNGTILIKRQLQKQKRKNGKFYLAPLKNNRQRTLVVAPSIMELFRLERSRQKEYRRLAAEVWDATGDLYRDYRCDALLKEGELGGLVFTNEGGGHLVGGSVYKRFKNICKSIGLEKTRFHDLRHSFAVTSLQLEDDIKTIQSNLGHASVSFTLDVYGHVSDTMKRNSARRMEALLQSMKNGNEREDKGKFSEV